MKKSNYRKSIYEERKSYSEEMGCAYLIGSIVQSVNIRLGTIREKLILKFLKESGKFSSVSGTEIKFNDNVNDARTTHQIDIVCITNDTVELFNVKPATHSNTDDPIYTVKTYLRAIFYYKTLYPNKRVTYSQLSPSGYTHSAYEKAGILSYDYNTFLSNILNVEVNIEKLIHKSYNDVMYNAMKKTANDLEISLNYVIDFCVHCKMYNK
jgi:hypothetical protein